MKLKIIYIFLFGLSFFIHAQTPPDAPLEPQQWVDKMGIGSWWIFQIPPAPDTSITIAYSDNVLDSLQTNFCINGGRLHWVLESPSYSSYDANGEIPQETIDVMHRIIDDFMERDMAICLNIQFTNPNDIKNGMNETLKTRMKNAWATVSNEFKDKSHNLAMCPVIEFHGWENLGNPARQDSLNVLYHDLTTIFRVNNPTRIMSYKPWGSAKRGESATLDFPFGNDPLPEDTEQFYYVSSFSGSAGMGDWNTWYEGMPQSELDALHFQTMNAGSSNPANVWGMRAVMQHREDTGIPFWCDHWRPNYHKTAGTNQQWTMEQNLAYVAFFENKLLEIGSAGAGIQTRTFWSDETNDLIRQTETSTDGEIMSVQFMDLLQTMCEEASLSISEEYNNLNKMQIFPNPATDYIHIEMENIDKEELQIYNLLGRNISSGISIEYNSPNKATINLKGIKNGLYFIKTKNIITKFFKY